MSRRVQVLTDCDFDHAGQEVPGQEITLTIKGGTEKAIGACEACWVRYVKPFKDAYEYTVASGEASPRAAPTALRQVRPAPADGFCPVLDCERHAAKPLANIVGWVQHMQRTHEWDQERRNAWLTDNGYEATGLK